MYGLGHVGPGPAPGQADFGEGSFEEGTPGNESAGASDPATPPSTPPVDGEAGSFDPDFEITSPQPAPAPQPQPTPTARVPAGILAFETRDFGVPPTQQLRSGQFHAPIELPGGSLVSTEGQAQALNEGVGQISGGDPGVPIVVHCSAPMCWLSYNAALRAIAAGYGNVCWYRGGLQAWAMAGLPLVPSGF